MLRYDDRPRCNYSLWQVQLGGKDAINIVCKSLKYSVEEKQYLRGYRRGNQNGKFKETGNKTKKNTTQYVLDTTIHKQIQMT